MGRRFAGRLGFSRDERADIEQELAIAVVLAVPRFDPTRGTIEAFITRVIRNKVRKIMARQKAGCRDYRRLAGSLQDPVRIDPEGDSVEWGESFDAGAYLRATQGRPSPEETTDLGLDLDRAALTLPKRLRVTLQVLRLDLTDTEAARLLRVSRQTFYARLKQLRELLDQAGISGYLDFPPDTSGRPPVGDE
jgi:RNA polymerase sigma factor (sigma-70 family)